MRVIATAGHVDHGKSTLVRALTGINPDRLKEEQARQMTIDLGFAWMTLPVGDTAETIGIVDVPGHRDFIENMLAGVGGIDGVMFVVAADEGVMPQTREHLAIIDLLGIRGGVVVLTKTDLVSDPEWIDLVQYDLEDKLAGTVLAHAPIVHVSARTGEGIDKLQAALVDVLGTLPSPRDLGKPRLWVDRVFSVSGFGTVVTGTLLDGALSVGESVTLQPGAIAARVRGLQTHNQAIQMALPGSRVAVNLAGVDRTDLRRGMLLLRDGSVPPRDRIEVRYASLPGVSRPLKHNAEVKFFCGAAETIATVRLLNDDGRWLQIELRNPLPLSKGDRYILRYPSPAETIGGGVVINPNSPKRWKRNTPEVLARLEVLYRGTPAEIVLAGLEYYSGPVAPAAIAAWSGFDEDVVEAALPDLAIGLRSGNWITREGLEAIAQRMANLVGEYHRAEPLESGIRPEKLRPMLKLSASDFEAIAELTTDRGLLVLTPSGTLALPDHMIVFNRAQQTRIDQLFESFAAAPYNPPSLKESVEIVGEEVLKALLERGDLFQIAADVLLSPSAYTEMIAEVRQNLESEIPVTIKLLRDRFSTSRKYAQAVLEYLDSMGVTRRSEDDHVLASGDWSQVL
jgi:selenocysteine-specific elongation factor